MTAVFGSTGPIEGQKPEGFLLPPEIAGPGTSPPPRITFTLGGMAPLAGEPVNGFPNWQERVIHQWINRARVDPQADLADCPAGNCAENVGSCYTPQNPLIWNGNAGRAARFHGAEMRLQSYFAHDSACTVVSNISTLYPGSCSGAASCACVGGTKTCTPTCTTPSGRMSLFSAGAYNGEIIAGGYGSVDAAFYAWLWEPSSTTACSFTLENGHRYLILKATAAVGTGYESPGPYYIADFAGTNSPIPKIPSGVHYPQQASSVDFWANWKDTAAPQSASVNVNGTCYPMSLQQGSSTNGAWAAMAVGGLGSGCHRYYFSFVDSGGTEVTWPSTGSYGIGTTSCADWDSSRPAACTAAPVAATWHPLPPCRVIDTRLADGSLGGPILSASQSRTFDVTTAPETCGIPSTARTITVNYTIVNAGQPGELRAFAGDGVWTGTSVISFKAGVTRANNGHLMLATDGTGTFQVTNASTGAVHFVLDVNGYYQ